MVTTKVLNWLNDAADITLISVGIAAFGFAVRGRNDENHAIVNIVKSLVGESKYGLAAFMSIISLMLVAKLVIKSYKIYLSTTVEAPKVRVN